MLTERKLTVSDLFHLARKSLLAYYDHNEATQLVSILFEHYAGLTRKDMIIDPERKVSEEVKLGIAQAIERLLKHEPVQYITGFAHFCGNEFRVTPDVLIPRPETEELVRWVLDENQEKHHLRILDVGTGSGCIAISLWLRFQDAEVYAFDLSEPALAVAAQNNEELGSEVQFRKLNFLNRDEWPDKKFDIIVSNPPYIPRKNKDLIPLNVAGFEPSLALFVPDDNPLIFYDALADFASINLKINGSVFMEIHEHFAGQICELFRNAGFSQIDLRTDINGKTRMVKAGM